jgi:hypothetical protein
MGVAPEVIIKFLFQYRLKISLSLTIFFNLQKKLALLIICSSGARSALLMGVALEAIMGCLQPIIRDGNFTHGYGYP